MKLSKPLINPFLCSLLQDKMFDEVLIIAKLFPTEIEPTNADAIMDHLLQDGFKGNIIEALYLDGLKISNAMRRKILDLAIDRKWRMATSFVGKNPTKEILMDVFRFLIMTPRFMPEAIQFHELYHDKLPERLRKDLMKQLLKHKDCLYAEAWRVAKLEGWLSKFGKVIVEKAVSHPIGYSFYQSKNRQLSELVKNDSPKLFQLICDWMVDYYIATWKRDYQPKYAKEWANRRVTPGFTQKEKERIERHRNAKW